MLGGLDGWLDLAVRAVGAGQQEVITRGSMVGEFDPLLGPMDRANRLAKGGRLDGEVGGDSCVHVAGSGVWIVGKLGEGGEVGCGVGVGLSREM